MKRLVLITLFFTISYVVTVKIPPSWKKCNRKDIHFEDCMTKTVENAIRHLNKPMKKLGLPSLEPLHLENVFVEAGNGMVGFQQNLTYLDIHGLTKIHLGKFDIDFDTKIVFMECSFPELIYDFDFAFNGTVMAFPLNGTGHGRVTMIKARYALTFLLDDYLKNGVKHFKVVNGKVAIDTKGLKVKLERLFKDDKELEDNVNKIFNDNWEIILEQGKGSYELILGKAFTTIFNIVLEKASVRELFGHE